MASCFLVQCVVMFRKVSFTFFLNSNFWRSTCAFTFEMALVSCKFSVYLRNSRTFQKFSVYFGDSRDFQKFLVCLKILGVFYKFSMHLEVQKFSNVTKFLNILQKFLVGFGTNSGFLFSVHLKMSMSILLQIVSVFQTFWYILGILVHFSLPLP